MSEPSGERTRDSAEPALRLAGIRVVRDGRPLLDGVDLTVAADQRWVVLGANGSGKTTLLRVASLWLHPTSGTVEVLGARLGQVDVRPLRARIGIASAAVADMLRPDLTAEEVVMTARYGALEPWWHEYGPADRDEARSHLARMDVAALAPRTFGTLSSGERQRVLVARTLMGGPGLVLLDEPAAGLDLGARERLIGALDRLGADPGTAPVVFVTHHVEEVPPSFTHALLLREGRVVGSGDIGSTLTAPALSTTFDLPLSLLREPGGRWRATAE